jgi:hypothetical protein
VFLLKQRHQGLFAPSLLEAFRGMKRLEHDANATLRTLWKLREVSVAADTELKTVFGGSFFARLAVIACVSLEQSDSRLEGRTVLRGLSTGRVVDIVYQAVKKMTDMQMCRRVQDRPLERPEELVAAMFEQLTSTVATKCTGTATLATQRVKLSANLRLNAFMADATPFLNQPTGPGQSGA